MTRIDHHVPDLPGGRTRTSSRVAAGASRVSPFLTLALLIGAALVAAAPVEAGESRRIDAVFKAFDSDTSPGCAVGVLRDGHFTYERGFGMASLEHGIPITPQTIFDIASTSKQFTAASVVLLALDGRLSLDDDIRRYLPEVPTFGRRITIRQLLQHTSGLRDYTDLLSFAGHRMEDLTTEQDGLDILSLQKGLNFTPGTEFRYDNTGFFLASVIVKRVSGKPLRGFAQERLFAPLGMTHTQFLDDHAAIVPHKATGYAPREGGGYELATSDWEQVGDGAVQTSVEDLALWDENFYTGTVGGKALSDPLQARGSLADGTAIPYGLGLFIDRYRGLDRVQHAGGWAGYRTMLMRFPSRHVSVIVLCNSDAANSSALSERVADIVLENELPTPAPGAEARDAAAVAPADLARHAGLYWNEHLGIVKRIVVKDGALTVSGDDEGGALLPLGGGRFHMQEENEIYTFGGPGAPLTVTDAEETKPVTFTRLAEAPGGAKRPSGALAQFAGRYPSDEVGAACAVSLKDGRLILRMGSGDEAQLEPISGDTFLAKGTLVQFTRDASKRINGLTLTNRGVVKLPFRSRRPS